MYRYLLMGSIDYCKPLLRSGIVNMQSSDTVSEDGGKNSESLPFCVAYSRYIDRIA